MRIRILAILLFGVILLAGCGKSSKQSATNPEEPTLNSQPPAITPQPSIDPGPQFAQPQLVDVQVTREICMESEGDRFCTMYYPVVGLGYTDLAGNLQTPTGMEALADAVDAYNQEVYTRQLYALQELKIAERHPDSTSEAFTDAKAHVTRSDSYVLSLYEHTAADYGWFELQHSYIGYTWDAQTGEALGFTDIFTDPEALPTTLLPLLEQAYPELSFYESAGEMLSQSIQEQDGQLCFALGYEGVHLFMADYWIAPSSTPLHLVLSYQDYPTLVKAKYQTAPDSWMICPEYDQQILLGDMRVQLQWEMTEDVDVLWTISVNDRSLSELFYGYEPECYILHKDGSYYLYLTVPAGDISANTNIYELTPQGAVLISEENLAIAYNSPMNPDHLAMQTNDLVCPGDFILVPWGWYSVDADGMPVLESGYGLVSRPLVTNCNLELRVTSIEDPVAHMDTATVDQGTQLMPFRTDMATYLDFLDEDGNAYRLEINEFSDDMQVPGYPDLDEMFS